MKTNNMKTGVASSASQTSKALSRCRNNGRAAILVAAAAVAAGLCGNAMAQTTSASYLVSHSFSFYPGYWPSAGMPPATWFTPLGVGSVAAHARAFTPGFAPQTQITGSLAVMPPSLANSAIANAISGPSHAHAIASISVAPPGPYGQVTGVISASGNATAVGPGSNAFAHSSGLYTLGGLAWRRGWISWYPAATTQISGSASASNPGWIRDPIAYEIMAPAGGIVESGNLLSINFEFDDDASIQWSGNSLSIAANTTGLFDVKLGDVDNTVANYVPDSMEGHVRLRLDHGTVVEASKTGAGSWLADWLLPAVGSSFSGIMQTSNGFSFGWDFQRDVDATIRLDQGGATPVPEPGEWTAIAATGLMAFGACRWRRRRA